MTKPWFLDGLRYTSKLDESDPRFRILTLRLPCVETPPPAVIDHHACDHTADLSGKAARNALIQLHAFSVASMLLAVGSESAATVVIDAAVMLCAQPTEAADRSAN